MDLRNESCSRYGGEYPGPKGDALAFSVLTVLTATLAAVLGGWKLVLVVTVVATVAVLWYLSYRVN